LPSIKIPLSDINMYNQHINVMKTKQTRFYQLSGKKAYRVLWDKLYLREIEFDVLLIIVEEPEVIVNDAGTLLAYRYSNHYRYKGPKYLPGEWAVTDPDTDVDAILTVINLLSVSGEFDPGLN
jgi:hypothetical protein